jgi:hypothetical protein
LRPFFLFVFSALDRTPRDKWQDPLTTSCLVRCSLQSLQGERARRIGERTWVVLAQIKIIFKYPKFSKIFFLKEKKFVDENEECFEIIFWNILFVLQWNSQN